MGEAGRLALTLIGPGTLAVFGLGFVWAWQIDRQRHYLLLIASACMLAVAGVLTQILSFPRDIGLNALVSNFFYTCAVLAAAEGLLRRSGKRIGIKLDLVLLAVFSLLIWYYFYVDRNLLARVYIQNFGYGLILFVTALRLGRLARARWIDRALVWILLLFSVQFFPRTVFTVGFSTLDETAFRGSIFWNVLYLSLAVLGAALALAVLAVAITDVIEDLRRERDVDRLTGVLNRHGFEARIARSGDVHRSGALVLCDLDHFKQINDTFGHPAGDAVLRRFGALLRNNARKNDVVGRIGGEEFAMLLFDSDEAEAQAFVARLRTAVLETDFSLPRLDAQVTASFGIAVAKASRPESLDRLFSRADRALYRAKNSGRNRIMLSVEV